MNPYHRPDPDAISELRADALHARRYLAAVAAHPDCNDPSHPGCARCEDRAGNPLETNPEECFA